MPLSQPTLANSSFKTNLELASSHHPYHLVQAGVASYLVGLPQSQLPVAIFHTTAALAACFCSLSHVKPQPHFGPLTTSLAPWSKGPEFS